MRIKPECVGCGQCVTFCPRQAISVYGCAVIGDKCNDCSACVQYCPVGAIRRDGE